MNPKIPAAAKKGRALLKYGFTAQGAAAAAARFFALSSPANVERVAARMRGQR